MTVTESYERLHRLVARLQMGAICEQSTDYRSDPLKVLLNDRAQGISVSLRVQLLAGYPIQRSTGAVHFTDKARKRRRHDSR